jgi:ATP-dependent DNA ligase
MIKIKHRRTVDCVVGGYREHKDGGMIGSLLLGLYDENGELGFIGHCSGFSDHDRAEIFRQFEALGPTSRSRGRADAGRREPLVGRQGPVVDTRWSRAWSSR